jgi:hypothetical protein
MPDLQKIKQLREIQGCEKHTRIAAGLKEFGHMDAQHSDSAIYWANVCDECADQLVTGQKTNIPYRGDVSPS